MATLCIAFFVSSSNKVGLFGCNSKRWMQVAYVGSVASICWRNTYCRTDSGPFWIYWGSFHSCLFYSWGVTTETKPWNIFLVRDIPRVPAYEGGIVAKDHRNANFLREVWYQGRHESGARGRRIPRNLKKRFRCTLKASVVTQKSSLSHQNYETHIVQFLSHYRMHESWYKTSRSSQACSDLKNDCHF